jgi:hypothetical protein
MSGPEAAWPTERRIDLRSGVGQAGGGPLDGRVRPHTGLTRVKRQRFAKLERLVHSPSLPECQVEVLGLKNLVSSESSHW